MSWQCPSTNSLLFGDICPIQRHKQLIFYSLRHLRQSLTFHHYTFQMWATLRRKMATWVILFELLRRLRSERAITTLGSKPCQWQSKRGQDITDLKPQAIYENPLRPWVWVSSVNESSKGFFFFHQHNVEQVCNSSDTLTLWCSMTSSSCSAEITLWTQRTATNNNTTTL